MGGKKSCRFFFPPSLSFWLGVTFYFIYCSGGCLVVAFQKKLEHTARERTKTLFFFSFKRWGKSFRARRLEENCSWHGDDSLFLFRNLYTHTREKKDEEIVLEKKKRDNLSHHGQGASPFCFDFKKFGKRKKTCGSPRDDDSWFLVRLNNLKSWDRTTWH